MTIAYTDHPIAELGDHLGYEAPIRRVEVLRYDGSLYCYVRVPGVAGDVEIKRWYLYRSPGRLITNGTCPPLVIPMPRERGAATLPQGDAAPRGAGAAGARVLPHPRVQ